MTCSKCFPNKQQREAGTCVLASLCVPVPCAQGKGTVKPAPSVMRVRRPRNRRSSLEKNGAFPFRLPGPQGGVWHVPGVYLPRTATGGCNRPVGLAGGIYLVYSGDVRPVLEINSNGHGWGGASGTGCAGHGGGVTKRERSHRQKKTAPLHHGEAAAW